MGTTHILNSAANPQENKQYKIYCQEPLLEQKPKTYFLTFVLDL